MSSGTSLLPSTPFLLSLIRGEEGTGVERGLNRKNPHKPYGLERRLQAVG